MFKLFIGCFKKIFNFSGRASRKEYLSFFLFYWSIFILFSTVAMLCLDIRLFLSLALTIYYILYNIIALSLSTRRLHDLNYSGWWQLTIFIPYGKLIMIILLVFSKGDLEPNRYGNPLD